MPFKDDDRRKAYQREYAKKWRAANPEKARDQRNKWFRKKRSEPGGYDRLRRYGLSTEQYVKMRLDQENSCYICKEEFSKEPHVDHCHETGRVRSLLCSRCNTGVAHVEKYGARLAAYLREHNG